MALQIVHVDNERSLRDILKTAFERTGLPLDLRQFASGEQALEYIAASGNSVDLFVFEIRLGGPIGGLDLAEKIRASQFPGRIVLTSAFAPPPGEVLAALQCEYVAKPWHIFELTHLLLDHHAGAQVRISAGESVPDPTLALAPAARVSYSRDDHLTGWAARIRRLLKAASATIWLSEDPNRLWGLPTTWVNQPEGAALDLLARQLAASNGPLLIRDLQKIKAPPGYDFSGLKFKSFVGVPLPGLEGSPQGSIGVADSAPRGWLDAERELLRELAVVVADDLELHGDIVRLEAHNQELSTYNNVIAHDLKTPLSAIIAYVDMAQGLYESIIPAEIGPFLTNITESATTMQNMIEQLLWLARLERPSSALAPVAVAPVIHAVLERFRPMLAQYAVRVEVSGELPSVFGLEAWIEEIFANLVSNAIKYRGDDNAAPQVSIRGQVGGTLVRYEVQDNGIGIQPEDQVALFQMFSRLNTVEADGLGLGLSIVYRMVTQMRGEVGVESVFGEGSTFWFTLPLAAA
ncbi:MAG TPA: hybrid sensor histidine kinase/response regulator [Aggregatilineaceae bacterium]|nr:hybrid sensor histidine kinase/response regulator [Aggregatilineaceae bacterium]